MKKEITRNKKSRESEKGAAMVMVLLVSFLLLVASAGLLLETSMNTMNVTDSTAEQQAYNAAESGVQSTINVLRGNVKPNPLFNSVENHKDNRITYGKAVRTNDSNVAGDSNTVARLSRWMTYNYAPNGIDDTARVTMGKYPNNVYDPRTGYAYSLSITDPDNTGEVISYKTEARFLDLSDPDNPQWKSNSITFGSSPNTVTVLYSSVTKNNLSVSSGSAPTNFGGFFVIALGSGATIPRDIRFEITQNMTAPYTTSGSIRGWIKAASVNTTTPSVSFDFDSSPGTPAPPPSYELMGSVITLNNDPLAVNVNAAKTNINGTVTSAEPFRVVIRSVGYGPRGARKELEATIQKDFFNGLSAPATLTLIGPPTNANSPLTDKDFHFAAGNSQNVAYSGDDEVSNVLIPSIGTTGLNNLRDVYLDLDPDSDGDMKPNITGSPSDISAETPFWLQSPSNLNATIRELRRVADASGRLFTNGETPGHSNFGNNTAATGITFVEGDARLRGSGGGILVCTGTLTLDGGFDFNGLIIVTGAGGVLRHGGGNGFLRGNTVVAPYLPGNLNAGFLAPKYDITGGGTSTIRYNSNSAANGMTAVSNIVLGVAEK